MDVSLRKRNEIGNPKFGDNCGNAILKQNILFLFFVLFDAEGAKRRKTIIFYLPCYTILIILIWFFFSKNKWSDSNEFNQKTTVSVLNGTTLKILVT